MIKRICICDGCGVQTDDPIAVTFGNLDLETESTKEYSIFKPDRREFCPGCASFIHSGRALQQRVTEELEPKEEKQKKKQLGRTKIDIGKIKALKNAGWSVKDIASEMHLEPRQISQAIYLDKKKREKENA